MSDGLPADHVAAAALLILCECMHHLGYEGKAVARSTVYRLLERHGWRKVVPRPRHPKADVAAQAAFKKGSVRVE